MEDKTKVTSAEIICTTSCYNKPYYEIKYKEQNKENYDIGYGSYSFKEVTEHLRKYFDIVEQKPVKTKQNKRKQVCIIHHMYMIDTEINSMLSKGYKVAQMVVYNKDDLLVIYNMPEQNDN